MTPQLWLRLPSVLILWVLFAATTFVSEVTFPYDAGLNETTLTLGQVDFSSKRAERILFPMSSLTRLAESSTSSSRRVPCAPRRRRTSAQIFQATTSNTSSDHEPQRREPVREVRRTSQGCGAC